MDMEKVCSNYRVCHEHFPQGSLRSPECRSRSGIKKDALPTVHVPHNPARDDEAQPPLEVAVDEAKQNQKMDTTNILTTQKIKNIVTKADFDLVCRCCLQNQNIIGNIQDIHFEQTHLPVIYKQLFQIQIMEENGDKPPNICHDCTSKAVQFWQFRQQVLINETLMQSLNIVTNLKREETTTSEQSQSELFFIDMNTSSIMLMKNGNNRDKEVLNEHSYCHGLETNQKTFVERKPIIEQFLEKTKNIGSNMRKVFETQFTCLTCAALFNTSVELKAHEKSFNHGPKQEVKIYKCKTCGHKTNKLGSHNTHMKIHRTERAYECPECKKKFKIARGLKVHMKIHLGKRDRICEFCGKGFLEQTELVIHQRTHTGERPFMCQACGKCFTSTGMCNLHYRTVHERNTTEYEHKCEHCDRTFRKRPFLEQHISKKHLHVLKDKKEKTEHKCCVCDVTCRTKHLFDAHMKKHEKI